MVRFCVSWFTEVVEDQIPTSTFSVARIVRVNDIEVDGPKLAMAWAADGDFEAESISIWRVLRILETRQSVLDANSLTDWARDASLSERDLLNSSTSIWMCEGLCESLYSATSCLI